MPHLSKLGFNVKHHQINVEASRAGGGCTGPGGGGGWHGWLVMWGVEGWGVTQVGQSNQSYPAEGE